MERREGAEGPARGGRVGHRGGAAGRRLARRHGPRAYARRITARTPCRLSGPAAGHALVRTAADPAGRLVLGTYNGCAHGWTPWGTYLTCEENWHFQFVNRGAIPRRPAPLPHHRHRAPLSLGGVRRALRRRARTRTSRTASAGWWRSIRTIRRRRPSSAPRSGAWPTRARRARSGPIGGLAFYMADDWEFEYVYKFVTARPAIPPAARPIAICSTTGMLYVARFNADGSGDWLPLVHGQGPLTAANGFADQGEVLVRTRQAADAARRDADGPAGVDRAAPGDARRVLRLHRQHGARPRRQRGAESRQSPRAQSVRPHPALARGRRRSRGHALSLGRLRARRAPPTRAAPSRATRSPARTGCGSTRRARSGWRRTCRPATSARATSRRWATTSCWPSIPPRACSSASSPGRAAARSPAFTPRRTTARPSSTSSTRARCRATARTRTIRARSSNWPDYRPDGRPRSATVVIRRRDGGIVGT